MAGFDALAHDAAAGIRLLRSLPKVDSARIGLYGHSQGGRSRARLRHSILRSVPPKASPDAIAAALRSGGYRCQPGRLRAFAPDGGAVGGSAPLNVVIDLNSGKTTQFNGYNNGFYHAGGVNGLDVDPNTGVAATTTELNSQVEFLRPEKEKGDRLRPVALHHRHRSN